MKGWLGIRMKNNVENRKKFFGKEIRPLEDEKESYGGVSEFRGKLYHVENIGEKEATGILIKADGTTEKFVAIKEIDYVGIGRTKAHADEEIRQYENEKIGFCEKIKEFKEKFKSDEMYCVSEFSSWHRRLTNSCYSGRILFMKEHNLSDNDKMSPLYFLQITSENDEVSKQKFEELIKHYDGSEAKYEIANFDTTV